MDIIDTYQKQLNLTLQRLQYSEISYDTVILPLIKDLLSEFETKHIPLPPRSTFSLPVDIYTEAITHLIIDNYKNNIINDTLPNECYILMLIRYPYFINILQCNRTFANYKQFRSSLLSTLNKMYPVISNQLVLQVQKMLSTNLDETYDIRKCSMIHYLHYFIDFRFDVNSIAITSDQLPKDQSYSYFIVNLTYNLPSNNAIVLYHNNPKIKSLILNPANMDKYRCIVNPPNVVKASLPYYSTDCNFKQIEYYTQNIYVLLCYNDDEDLSKCHYTIAYHGEKGTVNPKIINELLQGSITKSITDSDIENYINITFLKTFSDEPSPISEIKQEMHDISLISYRAFDSVMEQLNNETKLQMFEMITNEIISDPMLMDILDQTELPFFKIYLNNMLVEYGKYTNDPNYPPSKMKQMVMTYVCNYIHDSVFDESVFHD